MDSIGESLSEIKGELRKEINKKVKVYINGTLTLILTQGTMLGIWYALSNLDFKNGFKKKIKKDN